MRSKTVPDFWKHFHRLPKHIQIQAETAYEIWNENPRHNSLQFKRISKKDQIYSVRIGRSWRAIGVVRDDTIYWFWIGSHETYNGLIRQFQ